MLPDLNRVIKAEPANVTAMYFRAGTRRELNRWGEAVEDYTEVIRLDPKHGDALLCRGIL